MGRASDKGPRAGDAGAAREGGRQSLLDATPAQRLDWLGRALDQAYRSGALSPPVDDTPSDPVVAAGGPPSAAARKRERRKKKPKDDSVPRELERAGSLVLAFVNAGLLRRDDRRRGKRAPSATPQTSYADLLRWSRRVGIAPAAIGEALETAARQRPQDAEAAFALVGVLRGALMRIFTAVALKREVPDEDLRVLNGFLRRRGREVFPRADGFRRDWGGDVGDLERPLWPVAESAAELLASDRLSKVRQCAAQGCFRLFFAGNRRRLWCDANTCGSRDKGRRYQDMWRRADAEAATKTWRDREKEREEREEANGTAGEGGADQEGIG